MEVYVTITIDSSKATGIPTGKSVVESEKVVITDRMSWLELQELKARLTPSSDV